MALALAGKFDAIVHGCNCQNKMGAGIARRISLAFPPAHAVDQLTECGDASKLGSYSSAKCGNVWVINAYTQVYYSNTDNNLNLIALDGVMRQIAKDFNGYSIGLPRIGSGLAGGKWSEIEPILSSAFKDSDATIVTLPSP